MESKYRSIISEENLTSKSRGAISVTYTSDFRDFVIKKYKYFINIFYIDFMLNNVLDILN